MISSRLIEEKRLLQFLDQEQPTLVPPELFKRKTVKELQAYELVELTSTGACILTEKGKYIKRMTSNPRIELHTKGNRILNLKLRRKARPVERNKVLVKNRRPASILTIIISALLLPFQLLRTS